MVHRNSPLIAALIAIALFLFASLASGAASTTATPISCPNGTTVWLDGRSPPSEALLVYLETRPVGGGASDSSGAYRLPLRVRERPGTYKVEVRTRGSRTLVGHFTCYVDVPLDGVPTATAETEVVATLPAQPTPSATRTSAPSANSTPSPTITAAASDVTATPTVRGSTGSGATPTRTTTASPTQPPPSSDTALQISDVVMRDPDFPEDSEYIEITNISDSSVLLTGWKVVNTSRGTESSYTYTFPAFTLGSGSTVWVYSGLGDDIPSESTFYWNRSDPIWLQGNTAQLRDGSGRLVSSFMIQ